MAALDFDWGRFVDSQYIGLPKNNNWKKYPQWKDEVISSNPGVWTGDLGEIRDRHSLLGYHADTYRCACGEEGVGDWVEHVKGKVAEYLDSGDAE